MRKSSDSSVRTLGNFVVQLFGVLVVCVLGLFVLAIFLRGTSCDNNRMTREEWEKGIALLVSRYDAVRDWDRSSWVRAASKEERRAARTKEIRNALLRTDKKPVLMVGHIMSRTDKTDSGKPLLLIMGRDSGSDSTLEVWASCSRDFYERIGGTDGPSVGSIAAIIRVDAVMEPTSEEKALVSGLGIPATRLFPFLYCVTGTCLDMLTEKCD